MTGGNSGRANRALNSIKQNTDHFNYIYIYIQTYLHHKRKEEEVKVHLAARLDGRVNEPILQIPQDLFI